MSSKSAWQSVRVVHEKSDGYHRANDFYFWPGKELRSLRSNENENDDENENY